MKHLKKVETYEEYNAFIISSGFALPNVTKIVERDPEMDFNVKYNPFNESSYLWFYAIDDGSVKFTIPAKNPVANISYIAYSLDNGNSWTTVQNVDEEQVEAEAELKAGQKVLFKGECVSGTNWTSAATEASSNPARFSSTMPVNLGGNLASIMYGDDFVGQTAMKCSPSHAFWNLFAGMPIIYATSFCLPFLSLPNAAYQRMFNFCADMVEGPAVLPATNVNTQSYHVMFSGCTSLREVPTMNVTGYTGADCLNGMFAHCYSLKRAIVPKGNPGTGSWQSMYQSCTGITSSDPITATNIGQRACR